MYFLMSPTSLPYNVFIVSIYELFYCQSPIRSYYATNSNRADFASSANYHRPNALSHYVVITKCMYDLLRLHSRHSYSDAQRDCRQRLTRPIPSNYPIFHLKTIPGRLATFEVEFTKKQHHSLSTGARQVINYPFCQLPPHLIPTKK